MTRLAVVVDWPNGNVPWRCWSSIWNSDIRREPDCVLMRACSPDQNLSLNIVIATGLDLGVDEFLFIAADQTVPHDVLARWRSYNVPVVGAMTPTRQEFPEGSDKQSHHWLIYNFTSDGGAIPIEPQKPLQQVDVIGLGCSLVKAEVFRAMPPPWMLNVTTEDYLHLTASCDFFFYAKCKDYGIPVHIDATVESEHTHERILNAKNLHRNAPFLVEVHGDLKINRVLTTQPVEPQEVESVPA